jgi:hypothetical protein
MKKHKGSIESVMTSCPAVKAYDSAPGKYNEHPNLGPAGPTGGFPLKFVDTAVKQPVIQQTDNPGMVMTPLKRSK